MTLRARMFGTTMAAMSLAALDQVTKYLVTVKMPLHDSQPVIPGLLSLTYTQNTGAAFSMLHEVPIPVQLALNVAIVVLFLIIIRPQAGTRLGAWAMALILGGAFGNIVDRVLRQYVVDFLDLHLAHQGVLYRWPIFNLADIFVVAGVVMMSVLLVRTEFARKPEQEQSTL